MSWKKCLDKQGKECKFVDKFGFVEMERSENELGMMSHKTKRGKNLENRIII